MPITLQRARGLAASRRLWHKLEVERVGSRGRWLFVLSLALVACSAGNGDPADGGDVSGAWCGLPVTTAAACVGNNEPIYAEFAQAGTTVTGQSCEYYLAGSGC
jgi:hypothetical protein